MKKFENCADFIAGEENKGKMIDKRLLKEYNNPCFECLPQKRQKMTSHRMDFDNENLPTQAFHHL